MAAFDVKENMFYIVLGSVLVVFVMFYFIAVSPIAGVNKKLLLAIKSRAEEVQNLHKRKDTLPSEAMIQYHEERKAILEQEKRNCEEFFKLRDGRLTEDLWFESLAKNLKPGDRPELAEFQTTYSQETDNLLRELKTKQSKGGMEVRKFGVKSGEAFGSGGALEAMRQVLVFMEPRKIYAPQHMIVAQKQFWLIKSFLTIFEESGVEVLDTFMFKSRWDVEGGGDQAFIPRSVEFKMEMRLSDVAKLCENVLKTKDFMTEIEIISVEKRPHKAEVVVLEIPYGGDKENAKLEYEKSKAKKMVPPIVVSFSCRVLDYYPPKK